MRKKGIGRQTERGFGFSRMRFRIGKKRRCKESRKIFRGKYFVRFDKIRKERRNVCEPVFAEPRKDCDAGSEFGDFIRGELGIAARNDDGRSRTLLQKQSDFAPRFLLRLLRYRTRIYDAHKHISKNFACSRRRYHGNGKSRIDKKTRRRLAFDLIEAAAQSFKDNLRQRAPYCRREATRALPLCASEEAALSRSASS